MARHNGTVERGLVVPTSTAATRGRGRGASPAARQRAAAAKSAVRWGQRYTATAIGLSAALNGYAAAVAVEGLPQQMAGGAIGALVPVLVWMLAQVTAWTWKAGWRRLAVCSGLVAGAVLALSVCHVAGALAVLTGSHWGLATLLAVGVDCGLVSSEATAILVGDVAE